MKNSIKREQSQACLNFAERLRVGELCSGMRKNFRLQAKQKILMTLVLLITAVGGAWAEETLLTTIKATGQTTYSETTSGVVTVTHDNDEFFDEEYGWIWESKPGSVTVTAKEGYTITRCVFRQAYKNPVTVSTAPFRISFIETTDPLSPFDDTDFLYNGDWNIEMDGVSSIEVYGYAPAPATPNSIVINGTPQVGDKSISLTYHFDPNNVPGITSYAPTLKVKCAADNKWDEMTLSLHEVSSGTTIISLNTLGEFEAGKTYEVCFAYNNGNWVDEVFQSFVPAAPAPTGPEVTINDTKTEASFEMPQYDVTATYTIKRDISVDVTAQVGDGTQEQPRYRVKKDGNNKFIPADMEMAAVPALFTVNDAIEQKALTQTQDYIVQIYAIDAEGQPTGDPMTFATFTFEPGIYAVKAVAADDSDYAGETALSNTFKLFQGYEVQVAAKEFITYYKDEPLRVEDEAAELYTVSSVNDTQAVLSQKSDAMPSNTPMLVYNNSDETKVILLIPCNEPDLAITVAPEFQGTLTGTTIAASTENVTNYALNGKAFVFVKNDLPVAANKAWLSISNSNARTINLVFDDATKITNTNITNITNGDWYDLNGRKLNGMPTKKGVYIMNGKKVVIK